MAEDKDTRQKLLDSAKKEFLDKGYMKASLRTICKNAGVTTGALYFFFQDKEDLLSKLVEEPLKQLVFMVQQHFSEEFAADEALAPTGIDTRDVRAAKMVVRFMYQHYDEFLILLTKSQGSAYENIVSRFTDMYEQHNSIIAGRMAERCGVPKPNNFIIHWVTHMQISAFVHLLMYEPDEEKAVSRIEDLVVFLVSGWNGLLTSV